MKPSRKKVAKEIFDEINKIMLHLSNKEPYDLQPTNRRTYIQLIRDDLIKELKKKFGVK